MAALLGREPYGKAEARTQAAEVYEDSTGTPLVVHPVGGGARGFPPATRSRNPGLAAVQGKVCLHVCLPWPEESLPEVIDLHV